MSTQKKSFTDFLALAVSTSGVGYLPLAPGTWGSLVGVAIYLGYRHLHEHSRIILLDANWVYQQYNAILFATTAVLLAGFCILAIWASRKTEKIHGQKDSQKIVVDEIIGQLIVFTFVPFAIDRWLVVVGFVLFRVFDIWKPYPVKAVENLPGGIGVCADDIVAGVYGGICLAIIYVISLSF